MATMTLWIQYIDNLDSEAWLLNCLCVCVCVLMVESSRKSDTPLSNHDPRTAVQLRTALKRLKEIMEGKSQVQCLQALISTKHVHYIQ